MIRTLCLALCMVSLVRGLSAQPAEEKPNVLFIVVDDLGWADVGYQGSTFYETPHLNQLAKEGVQFTDAYAASPVCSPTRAALLTGKVPQRVGITNYGKTNLPLEEITLAEALKLHGYKTFFAGKWHLGKKQFPTDQGFEFNVGGWWKGRPKSYYSPYQNPKLSDGPNGEYLTDRLTRRRFPSCGNIGMIHFSCISPIIQFTPRLRPAGDI